VDECKPLALGMITGNCDDVIGEVYGDSRRVDGGVFHQARGVGDDEHSTDVSSPLPLPRVCINIHTQV